MQRKLVLEFTKMNGTGNDFIVIDNRFYFFSDDELSELARRFCRRRIGIGADGLLAFMPPEDEAHHHYRMKYYNADGSLGTMCGNGARCLARFAWQAGIHEQELVFESDAGVYRAYVTPDASDPVRLFVQPPQHLKTHIDLDAKPEPVLGPAHFIWTGTEHVVVFVNDVEATPLVEWGPKLRNDPQLAPKGANINFVEVLDANEGQSQLKVRTYEKGVEAETLACGTGAMASAVIANVVGKVDATTIAVQMKGGLLGVGFALDGDTVTDLYLEGAVETVYRGTVEV